MNHDSFTKLSALRIKLILQMLAVTLLLPSAFAGERISLQTVQNRISNGASDIKGIQVVIDGANIVVSGEVSSPRDYYLIHGLVDQYPGQAVSTVVIASQTMTSIADRISKDINDPNVLVTVKDNQIIMGGTVSSDSVRDQAEIIAKVYMPGSANHQNAEAIVNLIMVKGEK